MDMLFHRRSKSTSQEKITQCVFQIDVDSLAGKKLSRRFWRVSPFPMSFFWPQNLDELDQGSGIVVIASS